MPRNSNNTENESCLGFSCSYHVDQSSDDLMISCLGPLRRLSDTKAPFAVDSARWIVGRFGSLRQTPRLLAALGPLGHLAQEGNGFRKENPQANSQFAWI